MVATRLRALDILAEPHPYPLFEEGAVEAILDGVRSHEAQLGVMSTHRRGGLGREPMMDSAQEREPGTRTLSRKIEALA